MSEFKLSLATRKGLAMSMAAALSVGALAGAFYVTAPSAHAEARISADPTGEEIIEKYIEVTGGRAAYQKAKTRAITAKMAIAAQGLNGNISIWQKAPNMSYMTIELAGVGKIERGNNGEVAWEKNPLMGTRLLEGDEKYQADREADMYGDLNYKQNYSKIEYKGTAEVDGAKAHKVEMTGKTGNVETRYYDAESGLLLQNEMVAKSPQGEFPIVAASSDWQDVDGVKMPFKSTQDFKSIGMQQVVEIVDVKTNVEIPDSKFDLPDDVKAMVGKQGPSTKPSK